MDLADRVIRAIEEGFEFQEEARASGMVVAEVIAARAKELRPEKERITSMVMDALTEGCPMGLHDWLYTHDRALFDRIDEIGDGIMAELLDGSFVEGFRDTLRVYWNLHMEGMRLFKERKENAITFPEVRAARIAELEGASV